MLCLILKNELFGSSVCKARESGKAEAYFLYVENFHGERNAADGFFTSLS